MPSSEGLGTRFTGLLASLPFAVLQLGILVVLTTAGAAWRMPWPRLGEGLLLGLLATSMLTTTWKRWPYDRARTGFLLVHAGLPLLLLGLLGPPWLVLPGLACLALGVPWMFYLKPLLKRKNVPKAPPWQRFTLQGTRVLFLGALALLAAPLGRGAKPPAWALVSALLLALALHVHHLKGWKGPEAQFVGLLAWVLCLAAWAGL